MTEENRTEQEKKDELAEKDLDQASGGFNHGPNEVREFNGVRPDTTGKR